MLDLAQINQQWTIFLDRDGVINHEKENDYVYHPGEFVLYDGTLEAIKIFTQHFGKIIIVTNQRGIGRGLMTEENLADIHQHLQDLVTAAGGRIDAIYHCPALDSNHPARKPNPGMALQAKQDFPDIDFAKAIMVGNNLSDMYFGRNAGMHTVFVQTTQPQQSIPHEAIDLVFKDLLNFAKAL